SHATHRATDGRVPPVDAELRGEEAFDCDLVLDRDNREARSKRLAVVCPRTGAGGSLASSEYVRADDKELVGVDRCARADEGAPPPGARMPTAGRAAHVRVSAQSVPDPEGVRRPCVELAPGFVSDGDVGHAATGLEVQASRPTWAAIEQGDESPLAGVVSRPPTPGARGMGHGGVHLS